MMGKKIMQLVVNFMVRAIVGMCFIFLVNECLSDANSTWVVGQNVLTFLTSGILGIPGVCVLYGIQFLQFL